MKSSTMRSVTTVAVVTMLVLIAGSDTAPGVAGDSLVDTAQISFSGKTVRVTVVNHTDQTVTAPLAVTAALKGRVMEMSQVVTIPAGKSALVALDFPAPITGIIEAGVILDDGAPF